MSQTCSICSSKPLTPRIIRDSLVYAQCPQCLHWEKESPSGDLRQDFEAAQSSFYSGDTVFDGGLSGIEKEIHNRRVTYLTRSLSVGTRIVEVGPGSGHLAVALAQHGHDVHVVEEAPQLAEALNARGGISVICAEFESIEPSDTPYDTFMSFHVIEHVISPRDHLRKAFELVRPGGTAYVATPNAASWQQRLFPYLSPNCDSAHLHIFSEQSLKTLAQDAGWSVKDSHTAEYTHGWLRVLTKVLRRARGEDEESTAGKYSAMPSGRVNTVMGVFRVLSAPLRFVQERLGAGNEVLLILERPNE